MNGQGPVTASQMDRLQQSVDRLLEVFESQAHAMIRLADAAERMAKVCEDVKARIDKHEADRG